jgi:VRR-NUC domain
MKRRPPARMTEARFTRAVIDAARLYGWHCAHFRPARTRRGWKVAMIGHIGYPDLTLCHPCLGLLFVELKTQTGRISAAQAGWIAVLRDAGQRAYVWRPGDWQIILAVLRGERR